MIFKPQRAFEVEIIGRLVQQQKVGSGEQGRRKCDPHPPPAGKLLTWPRLICGRKAEPVKDGGGTGGRRMRVDVDEPGLDLGDPVRIMGGLGFPQQGIAFNVRLKHDLNQAFRPVRRFLREAADPPARRDRDAPSFGRQFAANGAEQR